MENALRELTLETPRLLIRHVRRSDANADYFALLSDEHGCLMDGYEPLKAMDETFAERMGFICQDAARYAIVHRESGRVIGETGLRVMDDRAVPYCMIDYKIHPDFRRQGYGREAVSALLDACFRRVGVPLVVAAVLPQNVASLRLVEALGFTREGLRRMSCAHDRFGPSDEVYFSLKADEWPGEAPLRRDVQPRRD
ncbi:MAG: GNAT family N-acetyltransferase [Christensenellaceae bacterium]|nr:GNAT family N-acetyltransferase [Christensenellaceae bacterium]